MAVPSLSAANPTVPASGASGVCPVWAKTALLALQDLEIGSPYYSRALRGDGVVSRGEVIYALNEMLRDADRYIPGPASQVDLKWYATAPNDIAADNLIAATEYFGEHVDLTDPFMLRPAHRSTLARYVFTVMHVNNLRPNVSPADTPLYRDLDPKGERAYDYFEVIEEGVMVGDPAPAGKPDERMFREQRPLKRSELAVALMRLRALLKPGAA
jgi:hypothetical protein